MHDTTGEDTGRRSEYRNIQQCRNDIKSYIYPDILLDIFLSRYWTKKSNHICQWVCDIIELYPNSARLFWLSHLKIEIFDNRTKWTIVDASGKSHCTSQISFNKYAAIRYQSASIWNYINSFCNNLKPEGQKNCKLYQAAIRFLSTHLIENRRFQTVCLSVCFRKRWSIGLSK